MQHYGVAPRRRTVTVDVGGVKIGSAHPVVVQSMTNTDTADVQATVAQIKQLADAGSEIVRITVNNDEAAQAVPEIVRKLRADGYTKPIVGDFHYNGHHLLTRYPECAEALDKYRINPGNVGTKRQDENFRTIIEQAIKYGKPVRIGVNWGSLDQQLLTEMMDENARSADPQPARTVMIGHDRKCPAFGPVRQEWAWAMTGLSLAPRCPPYRIWSRCTNGWRRSAITRCTWV